jgi:hypothetical protein
LFERLIQSSVIPTSAPRQWREKPTVFSLEEHVRDALLL